MTTLATSGNVKSYAGASVSSNLTDSDYTLFIEEAEAQLIADTGIDWVAAWPTISGNNWANIVTGAVAAFAAVSAVGYDPDAFATLNSAITTINVNLDRYDRAKSQLSDQNVYKPFGVSKMSQ